MPSSSSKSKRRANFKYYCDIFHYKTIIKFWLPGSLSGPFASVYSDKQISSAFKRSPLVPVKPKQCFMDQVFLLSRCLMMQTDSTKNFQIPQKITLPVIFLATLYMSFKTFFFFKLFWIKRRLVCFHNFYELSKERCIQRGDHELVAGSGTQSS